MIKFIFKQIKDIKFYGAKEFYRKFQKSSTKFPGAWRSVVGVNLRCDCGNQPTLVEHHRIEELVDGFLGRRRRWFGHLTRPLLRRVAQPLQPLVEIIDEVADVFEAGVDAEGRSFGRPGRRGAKTLGVGRQDQAFIAAP